MKPYKKLKFKLGEASLKECERLLYYEYEDRDLKDSVHGCAIKSIDGSPSNLFKKVPDLCSDYRLTSVAAQVPTIKVIDFMNGLFRMAQKTQVKQRQDFL